MFQSAAREADIRVPHFNAPVGLISLGQRAGVKPVRIVHCVVVVLAASQCWGCASASVGLQSDGRYILERSEQSADCQALYRNIWGRIQIIKDLPAKARAEQQTAPPTAFSLFGRLFGGANKGLDAVAQYNRERAHVYALQLTMVDKKCLAVDVEGELTQASAEMARIRSN